MRTKALLLCGLLSACAAAPPASSERKAEPVASVKQERSWRDKLGIPYVANSLACTYKLWAFFSDSAAARPEPRSSGSDALFSCLGNK